MRLTDQQPTTVALLLVSLGAAAMGLPAAGAASDAAATERAQRTARADAHARLLGHIGRIKINATTTVNDFVAEDDRIASTLRTRLGEAARFSRLRVYTDGAVEVDAEVTLRWVATTLRALHAKLYHGTRVKATDLAGLHRNNTEQFIIATGVAVITDATDPLADRIAPGDSAAPAGWKNVTTQGMAMARRAAEFDAYRRLGVQIGELRIARATTLGQRLADDEDMQAQLRAFTQKAAMGEPQYEPDRVCMVRAEIRTDALIAALKSLRTSQDGTDALQPADLERLRQTIRAPAISVVGRGVPPPTYVIQPENAPSGPPPPAWAKRTLRATGNAGPPSNGADAGNGRHLAGAIAFVNAHRKLAEELDAVEVAPTTTVSDLVESDDRIQADIATYLEGVRRVSTTRAADGTATVVLELPLERLWHIVRRGGDAHRAGVRQ